MAAWKADMIYTWVFSYGPGNLSQLRLCPPSFRCCHTPNSYAVTLSLPMELSFCIGMLHVKMIEGRASGERVVGGQGPQGARVTCVPSSSSSFLSHSAAV